MDLINFSLFPLVDEMDEKCQIGPFNFAIFLKLVKVNIGLWIDFETGFLFFIHKEKVTPLCEVCF